MNQGGERLVPDDHLKDVYDDLRRLAAAKLSNEKPGQTLQATALVHEAYLRLFRAGQDNWENSAHFYSAVAEAMRRILIGQARRRKTLKRGGNFQRIEVVISGLATIPGRSPEETLILDEAFSKLELDDPSAADVARLRVFAGLGLDETAESLGIPRTTAFRHWTYARAFLHHELGASQNDTATEP